MPKGILIVGSITEGFQFVGPFPYPSDAVEYAQRVLSNDVEWSVTDLESPELFEQISTKED